MIVKYSKKFPYAPYLNEDIGFEESIMDGASEEEMLVALRKLSSVALKFHKENNPQLFGVGLTDEDINWAKPEPFIPQPPPVIDPKAIERLEILIDDAKVLYDLQILQGKVAKYGLQEAYDRKMDELLSTASMG